MLGSGVFLMKNFIRKIHAFLERIDFFVTMLHIAWSVCVVFYSIVCDVHFLKIDVPFIAILVFLVFCICMGVYLQKKLSAEPNKKSTIVGYHAFYFGIPVFVGIVRTFTIDAWYEFKGSFMPGLEALGLMIFGWIIGGVAILACGIFWGVRLVGKHREKKGKTWNQAFWRKLRFVLNALLFWGIVIAALAFAGDYGVIACRQAVYESKVNKSEAYLKERLAALSKLTGETDPDEVGRMIMRDGFTCCFIVENLSKGYAKEDVVLGGSLDHMLELSHLSDEVLAAGMQNYRTFTDRYQPERSVEMLNQEIVADAKEHTVSVSVQLYVLDTEHECLEDAYMIVTFDEEWNVVDIRCSEERLRQNVPD